jgi:hypothetical protein
MSQISLQSISRRWFSFPAAIAAILVGKAFWTCRGRIVDTDLWWHLRNGQYLLDTHSFPVTDTYSFTATGADWVDHSWLPEVAYYAAYHALGLRGVFLVFFAAVALLSLGIFWLCRKETEDPLAAGLLTIYGGLLAMVGYTPRAQLFGWLCFLGIYGILLQFRRERRAPLWMIPPLFALWINCHAGWPFGLALFLIVLGAGLVQSDLGSMAAAPWTRAELRRLLAVFAASLAALFVNPFGYRLVSYPWAFATRLQLPVAYGEEWASVNFNDMRGVYVLVLLAAIFLLALRARGSWRIDDVMLAGFVLYWGLAHIRFLLPAGIVLPPLLAPKFGRISSYQPGRERTLLNAGLMAAVLGLMVARFPSEQMLIRQTNQFFPAAAVEYLKAHPAPGRMFNLYEWGGYLEWHLRETPTFIDSRTDIFEYGGVVRDYIAVAGVRDSEEILDRYHIGFVLYPADSPLAYLLSRSPRWKKVYADGQAVVYQRADP